MPIDASIPLQVKPIEMPNPLDSVVKALTMKNLMQENQSGAIRLTEQQRAASDSQTLRDAFKNNSAQGPDGSPVVNRQGVMKDLMTANPLLAQSQDLSFKQMDLENLNRQHSIAKGILSEVRPGDQTSVDRAFALAKQYNLPPLDNVLPKNANDPNFGAALHDAQMKSMTAEEQLAQANKEMEFKQQAIKNQLENKKLGVEMAHFDYDKKFNANQQVQQAIESGRQAPDAQQELKDVLSAKKIQEITAHAPGGDLNKLNNQQTKLAMMEVVKMAGGSVPTEGELESMTPDGLAQKYGGMLQKVTNKSQPANAGEFLQQGIDYANGIASIGKKGLSDRANRIVEQRKEDLGPRNYQSYKENIQKEFGDVSEKKKDDAGKKTAGGAPPPEGSTKQWEGKTYKLVGDHWVSQSKQAAK